jgi:transaldolase
MPDAALNAFLNNGKVARTIDANLEEAERIYNKIEELGILWSDVGSVLELEGVASFKKSFTDLVKSLSGKAETLAQSN